MKLTKQAVDLIKAHEGLRTKAYYDPVGILTIGYGHTNMAGDPKVTPGMVITKEQAAEILKNDLENKYSKVISKYVKVPINDNQFGALTSLIFNIGEGAFAGSTVLKRLNKRDYKGAANAFAMWNRGTVNGKKVVLPGLVKRRAAEAEMFMTGGSVVIKEAEKPVQIGPVPSGPTPSATPASQSTGFLGLIMAILKIFGGK